MKDTVYHVPETLPRSKAPRNACDSNTVDNKGLYGYYDFDEYQGNGLTIVGRGVGLGTAFQRSGGFGAIGRLLVLFPDYDVDAGFLVNYINHKVRVFEESSGIPQLTGVSIANYKIPLPPTKSEQSSIAKTLSDTDALIGGLEKLIAKKRNIKQGAMQELLTGKRRLPGFIGEWGVKKLGELGNFSKGKAIRKDEVLTEGLPCVRYGEIYTTHNDYIKSFFSFISRDVAIQSQRIKKGDLLFAGSGETAEEIGKCVAFVGDEEAYAGGDIIVLAPEGVDSFFLGYLMNYSAIVRQKSKMGQGDAVVHISANNLSKLILELPPTIGEQTTIADVLSDMDKEIEALEKKLAKYHMIKQGMMQELLTGNTRLV